MPILWCVCVCMSQPLQRPTSPGCCHRVGERSAVGISFLCLPSLKDLSILLLLSRHGMPSGDFSIFKVLSRVKFCDGQATWDFETEFFLMKLEKTQLTAIA